MLKDRFGATLHHYQVKKWKSIRCDENIQNIKQRVWCEWSRLVKRSLHILQVQHIHMAQWKYARWLAKNRASLNNWIICSWFLFKLEDLSVDSCPAEIWCLPEMRNFEANIKVFKNIRISKGQLSADSSSAETPFCLNTVSPRMNTNASLDQLKPIRIGENLMVKYNAW